MTPSFDDMENYFLEFIDNGGRLIKDDFDTKMYITSTAYDYCKGSYPERKLKGPLHIHMDDSLSGLRYRHPDMEYYYECRKFTLRIKTQPGMTIEKVSDTINNICKRILKSEGIEVIPYNLTNLIEFYMVTKKINRRYITITFILVY